MAIGSAVGDLRDLVKASTTQRVAAVCGLQRAQRDARSAERRTTQARPAPEDRPPGRHDQEEMFQSRQEGRMSALSTITIF